jgi:hypothetical protein
MKTLSLCIVGAVLITAVAVSLWIQNRAEASSRSQHERLQQQADSIAQFSAENERLSNIVVHAKNSQSLSESELMELLRLRNEVRQLRWTLKAMEQLQREIRRVHDVLTDLAKDKERGGPSATTLSTDELEQELRKGRVAQFKEWLKEAPAEEKTPELQFLPEEFWAATANWPRLTDREYQGWISGGRAVGELKFAGMAFNALKQYAQANNGQFPTDVSQLKPYFDAPFDDAILNRYDIVPANSLPKFLAEVSGDWVITQKAPVHAELDGRVSIGLTNMHSTLSGAWGNQP